MSTITEHNGIAVGDVVCADGYEGTWIIKAFANDYRSSSQGECCAALEREDRSDRLFYPSTLVTKE